MDRKILCDGTLAFGPLDILNLVDDAFLEQKKLNAKTKFHPGEIVEVTATIKDLTNLFIKAGDKPLVAKNQAIVILGNKTGEVLGATICDEGTFYTIEMETIPMCFLPENFLKKI